MFAFAIWDQNKRQLFCARDRLGIKPFYYFWDGRVFAFASEIKALLQHPEISARVQRAVASRVPGLRLYQRRRDSVQGHPQAHARAYPDAELRPALRKLEIKQYWDAPCPTEFEQRPDEEWIAECRTRLEEVVRMRLMSDVPLGMFLSGGVDSSAIAALIKRMADGPVKTFSVGYSESKFSELSEARQVAEQIGTDHHEVHRLHGRVLQRPAAAGVARRRTDHLAIQRLALLRFEAGARTGESRPDRRGQRRTVWRLRPLPLFPAQPAMDARLSRRSQRRSRRDSERRGGLATAFGFDSAKARTHGSRTRCQHRIAVPEQLLLRVRARKSNSDC